MTCRVNKIKMVSMVTPVMMISLIRIGTFGQKDQNRMLLKSWGCFFATWCEATDMRRENLGYNPFQVLLALISRNQFNLTMNYCDGQQMIHHLCLLKKSVLMASLGTIFDWLSFDWSTQSLLQSSFFLLHLQTSHQPTASDHIVVSKCRSESRIVMSGQYKSSIDVTDEHLSCHNCWFQFLSHLSPAWNDQFLPNKAFLSWWKADR